MLFNLLPEKTSWLGLIALPVIVCALLLAIFKDKLPRDQGREFAFNGKLSAGKIRGAGIIFVCAFIIVSLLALPLPFNDIAISMNIEYYIYLVLIFFGMLSGYLDDRAEKPWGEYKKGIIDLIISALTAANFVYFNPDMLSVSLFGFSLNIHPIIFGVIGTVLVWMLINATNCSDGIDGFCGSLTIVSLVSAMLAVKVLGAEDIRINYLIIIMICTLLPYLWRNAEPSTMMMGDAGSRALGLFLCICIFKTGNILLVIPLCFMLCLDGLLGIVKVSLIRFLKIKNAFKNIRTPLHDHFRKNKGWSNTQVIFRFCMIQALISALTIIAIK